MKGGGGAGRRRSNVRFCADLCIFGLMKRCERIFCSNTQITVCNAVSDNKK